MKKQTTGLNRVLSLWVLPALLATIFLPEAAHSQLAGGCRCGAISGFHSETRRHVSEETTEAADEIVRALKSQSQQNSGYLDRQVEADRRIADGEAQNAARLARSLIRAEAESGRHDPNPDFCLLMDSALEPVLPERHHVSGIDGITGAATDWSVGRAPVVRENGVRMAAWLAEERERLKDVGGARDATTDWEFALNRKTLPLDDPAFREALSRLVANTVDPFPSRPLTESDLKTPAGLAEAVRRGAAEARNRAAIAAVGTMLKLSEPAYPASPYRKIVAQSRSPQEIPDVLGELQALDIRIAAYSEPSAATLNRRHSKTEKALLQDLIDIQSLNARISHLRLIQEAGNTVVLAAILGILTDGATANLIPQ
ncbi:MAG: hypothetical protein J4F49_10940 [Rhodobacteraceae bacterium]|nr:hypothetical protein [Paracoccaceae bacterium]